MSFRIGIDFDNTIIDYGKVFHDLARAESWLAEGSPTDKESVKQELIRQDGNDLRWQSLQAKAYGSEIHRAKPFSGLIEFLSMACARQFELFIVSQKSETSHYDQSVKLREWAWHWIEGNRVLDFFEKKNVFFESTREEKIARIKKLQCDIFIDDLSEVLEDPAFPPQPTKILFNPLEKEKANSASVISLRDWSSITMLLRNGLSKFEPIKRDGNSRIFKASDKSGKLVRALKRYHDPDATPTSSKCLREFTALSLLWSKGERQIPEAIACDPAGQAALYQFIEGRPLTTSEITASHVEQAIDFLGRLAVISQAIPQDDVNIGEAVDSRTCLKDYLDTIDRRLSKIRPKLPEARDFVADRVFAVKRRLFDRFKKRAESLKLFLEDKFDRNERMLSPSDFGFHNALLGKDGKLVFLDFEYFGWDDPAKLAADFNHTVASEIPSELRKLFIERFFAEIATKLPGASRIRTRFDLVNDLIGFEWILIVLNVFSPEALARRKFANPGLDEEKLLADRLAKAKTLLARYE